jgi:hypothetical protein
VRYEPCSGSFDMFHTLYKFNTLTLCTSIDDHFGLNGFNAYQTCAFTILNRWQEVGDLSIEQPSEIMGCADGKGDYEDEKCLGGKVLP